MPAIFAADASGSGSGAGPGRAITRPRVLIVSQDYSEIGLRRQILSLQEHCEVLLVAPEISQVLVFEDHRTVTERALRTVAYPTRGLFGAQYVLRTVSLGMRRFAPDIVYVTYEPWATIYLQAALAASLFAPRAQLVCGAKKNTYRAYPGIAGGLKRALARAGLRRADHLIAASRLAGRIYTDYLGLDRAHLSVLPRVGVDTSVFKPRRRELETSSGAVAVGYCGRLVEDKGVLDLVDAVRLARSEHPDMTLELLGAGSLRRSLEEIARSEPWLRIHEAVPTDQVAAFLRRLDVYALPARVLPDHQEHDGHALIQALACGLPTVATRSGIVPEILADSPEPTLVPASDPATFASAISRLAGDPVTRDRLGGWGRDLALARYSNEAVAIAYADTFRRILERRGS